MIYDTDTGVYLPRTRVLQYNDPKYKVRQAWVNSVDPDQTPQNDQGLHYLPFTLLCFRHINM